MLPEFSFPESYISESYVLKSYAPQISIENNRAMAKGSIFEGTEVLRAPWSKGLGDHCASAIQIECNGQGPKVFSQNREQISNPSPCWDVKCPGKKERGVTLDKWTVQASS